jgi:hypothetical protein
VPLLDQLQPVVPGPVFLVAALGCNPADGGTLSETRDPDQGRWVDGFRTVPSTVRPKLVLFEISELARYTVDMELRALLLEDRDSTPVLGSIIDSELIARFDVCATGTGRAACNRL